MGAYDRELQPLVVTPKHQFRQHFGRSVRSLARYDDITMCVVCGGARACQDACERACVRAYVRFQVSKVWRIAVSI